MVQIGKAGLLMSAILMAMPAHAQDVATPATPATIDPPAATAAPDVAANGATIYDLPDPATLKMPVLAFTTSPEIEGDFDKYFYFHRDATSFAEAFADIKECDALASGSNIYLGANDAAMSAAMAQYGLAAGAIGGAIGGAIADAIFGSAARRQQRRINLRNCMGFKGYARYGLAGEQWKEFNFEEGHGRKKEGVREEALELQALVASGPKPQAKELGL